MVQQAIGDLAMRLNAEAKVCNTLHQWARIKACWDLGFPAFCEKRRRVCGQHDPEGSFVTDQRESLRLAEALAQRL